MSDAQGLQGALRKTKLCRFFASGRCNHQSCNFAHSADELRDLPNFAKTRMCPDLVAGGCSDPTCSYAHSREQLRVTGAVYKTQLCVYDQRGRCRKGSRCTHAHGDHELNTAVEIAHEASPVSIPLTSTHRTVLPPTGLLAGAPLVPGGVYTDVGSTQASLALLQAHLASPWVQVQAAAAQYRALALAQLLDAHAKAMVQEAFMTTASPTVRPPPGLEAEVGQHHKTTGSDTCSTRGSSPSRGCSDECTPLVQ
mmetsp:Transcript_122430/g.280541  ORF Transcript_122430/g.280541 Transcript_122430/m.280541 type:complete len:253 (-) Transcript_122430:255-1013(-)